MVDSNGAAIVASSVLASTCIILIILVVYLLRMYRRKPPPYPPRNGGDAIKYRDFPPLKPNHESIQPSHRSPLKYCSSLKLNDEIEDSLDPNQYGFDMAEFYSNKRQIGSDSSLNQLSKSSDSLDSILEEDDTRNDVKGYHHRPVPNTVSLDNINTPCTSPPIRRIKKQNRQSWYKHSSQRKDLSRPFFRGISECHPKECGSPAISSSAESLQNLGYNSDETSPPLASDSEQTNERSSYGQMRIALCHNPSEGKLTVTVKSAEGLEGVSKKTNPFVKIRVYDSGERKYKKKTAVKQNTTSPKYEESFDFIVTGKRMPQTSVILRLFHHGQRFLTNDALIGLVFLGYQFELDGGHPFKLDYGARHWASIIEKPHLTIEEWHPIQTIATKGN